MIDSFVLVAPVLLVPVVALLGFIGCDLIFPLVAPPSTSGPGPTGLVAVPGNAKVSLSWDVYPGATAFNVKRGEMSGVYTATFMVTGAQAYTDTNVTNGTPYFYVVTALPQPPATESEPSNEVQATPTMAALVPFITSIVLGSVNASTTGFFGMAIVVGANALTVLTLGRGFAPGNSQIHVVKIVDAQGVDVPNAFVSVSMAGGVVGERRYAPLNPPVVLNAGATYFIVSQEIAGGDDFYNHNTMIQTTDVASVPSAARGGPPYVEDSPAGRCYGLVDFQY